jgi:hypothetical protein
MRPPEGEENKEDQQLSSAKRGKVGQNPQPPRNLRSSDLPPNEHKKKGGDV